MAAPNMDVDMTSPPASPRPHGEEIDVDVQPRSQPRPIASAQVPRQGSRFQPQIGKTSAAAFTPIGTHSTSASFMHNKFKPKATRTPSSAVKQSTQTTSPFSPLTTPLGTQQRSQPIIPSSSPTNVPDSSSGHADATPRGRSLKRTAPLQIPQSAGPKGSAVASSDTHEHVSRSVGTPTTGVILSLPASLTIPQSLPTISPSFPATLFGGLSADDEHVTVWEPSTGKTVAGNAAPYRRNLAAWLAGHPGWEEKADELKSSKRRSAARRSRNAAEAFAALCCYPVATFLASDAARYLQALGEGDYFNDEAMMMWTSDDFMRLQEALFRLGQDCHSQSCNVAKLDEERWMHVTAQIGGSKLPGSVVYCAHHMLTRGILKSQKELANASLPSSFGAITTAINVPELGGGMASSPLASSYDGSVTGGESFGGPSSMPTLQGGLSASFLERSFRAPREPRVTVWNPSNGRTISGNAAPCRRNLEAWMRDHPGWRPKEEGQLSSSRRNRNKKIRPSSLTSAPEIGPSSMASVEPESPHFHDALEGLLYLSKSPSAASPPHTRTNEAQLELGVPRSDRGRPENGEEIQTVGQEGEAEGNVRKKMGMTSSVSSSSGDDGREMISDAEDQTEEGETSKMEL